MFKLKTGDHYWALGPRQRPINPRQRLCRGRPSAKSSRGILSRRRGSLPRALYRALGKAFAEGWTGTRQRKAAVTAPAPGTESLPRAVSGGPRQRIILFFWKIFAEGLQPWPSAKKCCRFFPKNLCRGQWDDPRQRIILFLKKNLCRGPPTMALGKEMLQKFYFF